MDGKISPGHWRKATEIYGEALELPADARDGWLKAACGTDVTLLATVRAMLQKHNELNSFLEVLVHHLCQILAITALRAQSHQYQPHVQAQQ